MKSIIKYLIFIWTFILVVACSGDETSNNNPNNLPPSSFDLLSIANNASGLDLKNIIFSWEVPFDPDGDDDTITYEIYISTDPNNIDILIAWSLIEPKHIFKGRFNTCTTYYWKVKAIDKEGGETYSTSIFSFTTRNAKISNNALTSNAPFPKRHSHQTIAFDNKLWLIAGTTIQNVTSVKTPYNDVWYSNNGVEWEEATGNAPFSKRYHHSAITFNNKMWVIGGVGEPFINLKNEIWYSTDGWNWTEATNQVGLPNINRNKTVVFKNKIFLFSDNKIWSSSNATTWLSVTNNTGFSSRFGYSVTVFNDELWVIGGATSFENRLNDIWKSPDGVNWQQLTSNAPFSKRTDHTATVFDNKLYVIGGQIFNVGEANDIWFTKDGMSWTQATSNMSFQERTTHTATVFNDKIYVIAGADNSFESSGLKDVWTLE